MVGMSSPAGVVDAAGDVRDADDGRAAVDELLGGDAADVRRSLDDTAARRASTSRSQARAMTITTPAPVASWRKTDPPIEIGLPVTISGTA